MRNRILLFLSFFLAFVCHVNARNYYVSAAGNNLNDGLTPATAWQTITKVNAYFASMAAGDSILFRRGDTFLGAITVNKSGTSVKPIVISAYGTGAKPVISGFVTASSWTAVGNGVYQALYSGAKSTLNMVTLNNAPQALGRYPNADAANGGYLSYESFSGAASITDNELTSTTNWTGAEVVIRKKLWVLDRCKITAHSGTTISYTNTNRSTYDGTAGFGYFFQNDARTLDKLGEWYFNNSTKNLQMYFGTAVPSSYTVKASVIDTLLTLNAKSYIDINNIAFEGANVNAVYSTSSNNISIKNCDFSNAGTGAIYFQTGSNLLIENCTTVNVLSNAIWVNNLKGTNITIRNCVVKKTGIVPGMGLSEGNSYKGIVATVQSGLLVEYNNVDTTGYVGIEFQGSNVTVKNNVVNYFDFVKDDAGGIYSYASGTDANPGTAYTNRVIRDNIVMNGIGASNGRSTSTLYATGIYLDGRTMNVDVLNNTVFNHPRGGIHSNNPISVNIKGNTSFNNQNAVSIFRWAWGGVSGLSIKNNTFYPKSITQRVFAYTNSGLNEPVTTTVQEALNSLGNIDSNYYNMANPIGFNSDIYPTTGAALLPTSPLSLEAWQMFTGHDNNSKKPARLPVSYKLNGLIGTNKVTNGTFSANISGFAIYGTNVTGSWDNTSKINGGALKISFSNPVGNKYNLIYSAVGAISATKNYVFRFSTYGTSQQGIVRAYLRKTVSPYTNLIATQVKTFGIGRKDHEFLFAAPPTDAGASFVIEIEQNSGTTYIDNIEFYEANATVYDAEAQLRFEYNDTKVAKTIPLNGIYTAVNGTVYSNTTLTLQPYTSIILVRDTGSRAPLNVTATYTAVKCFGDNSTITVAATGGTAPYTGTGTFVYKAGNYIFLVTDASGDTASVSITITQPSAALRASASAEVILVMGGTTTVSVTAVGGTAPYSGTGMFTVTAGTYNYTVTDANGCIATVSITVTDANGPLVAVSSKSLADLNCYGDSSSVAISAVGGKAPYRGTGTYRVGAGKGSMKIAFPSSVSGAYTLIYFTVGAISSSKNYTLRFTTLGTTAAGKLRASIRMTTTPFTTLTTRQNAVFGNSRKDHEFRFIAPPSQTAASFLIEIDQSSGTTYLDNIAFFESDSAGALRGNNLYSGQFEKNITGIFTYSSNNNYSTAWDSTGKIAATHYFTITDSVNTSAVAVVNTAQPSAPLKVTASSTAIGATGGFATVTVTATGGTAPYTGTGSFSVTAGTYIYRVTDAKGCTTSVTITVSSVISSVSSRTANPGSENTSSTQNARINANASIAAIDNRLLQLSAYPNPTNTSFNLLAEGGTGEKLTVVVYSFDGKIAYQTSGSSNTRYNIGNNFMPGVYIVKVTQGATTKIIKLVKAGN
ncbi:MAG: right-handed parallel beta-helix repeat-containing protein [Chitinophagaceae bacterium]|nr:right-handed parallel beta-helix repeat-containing protein [Chitinophagaceae bacterium]